MRVTKSASSESTRRTGKPCCRLCAWSASWVNRFKRFWRKILLLDQVVAGVVKKLLGCIKGRFGIQWGTQGVVVGHRLGQAVLHVFELKLRQGQALHQAPQIGGIQGTGLERRTPHVAQPGAALGQVGNAKVRRIHQVVGVDVGVQRQVGCVGGLAQQPDQGVRVRRRAAGLGNAAVGREHTSEGFLGIELCAQLCVRGKQLFVLGLQPGGNLLDRGGAAGSFGIAPLLGGLQERKMARLYSTPTRSLAENPIWVAMLP